MLRWLLLLLLAVIIYRMLRRGRVSGRRRPSVRPPEQMLICAQCGVHLPESEALVTGGQTFCCDQHRELWTQSN